MPKRIIGVDLDGTLCEETEYNTEGFKTAKPRQNIIDLVNKLYEQGDKIIVWTGRGSKHRKVSEDWLKKHGVRYHSMLLNKLRFDLYIDERRKLLPVSNSKGR